MKNIVLVLTEPTEGKQDEFDDYYENLHLDEVLSTTGWDTAKRFELVDEVGGKCPLKHLALYEVETDDPADIIPTLNRTRSERQQSGALNKLTASVWVFSETGSLHRR
ncbi:MAG: hypothetical protein CMQ20_12015 [Gammaproteobacteria bacterium]|nr:hypothetical protein [Gammaproteobacteria bacterium]